MRFITNHPYTFAARATVSFFFVLFSFSTVAQLRADFSMNRNGGCAPLNISFTNTSTGTSAATIYHWDFDNGNTSALKDPGSVFTTERQYTIKLTIQEGAQTSVQTKTITVYKKPVVDFSFSPDNGCSSLPVTFTSLITPGDGTITTSTWDFGDGVTQQAVTPSVTHVYTSEQTPAISLTVLNSNGCAGTITKTNIITVRKELIADFGADKTIACTAPADIRFINRSAGPGTLSYQWDFGDGNTSTQPAPLHTYTRRGTYRVRLTVTSSEGCTKLMIKNAYINIEDFVTDFDQPVPICSQRNATLNNISTPAPDQSTWLIDGTTSYSTIGNSSITHYFATEGIHTVQLTNNFGICQHTITKQIDVKKTPLLNGFLVDIAGLCGAPLQVNFKDTSASAVSWKWNFDWYSNNTNVDATTQSASHTYNNDNQYQVRLTITTADGCDETVAKQVGISRPLVGIFLAQGTSSDGCLPFTVAFTPRSTDPISTYLWNFGDGATSTAVSPSHTYTTAGTYNVSLSYTTVNGCTGTVYYSPVRAYSHPVADFTSLSGTTICGNTPVLFQSTSTGPVSDELWFINGYAGSSSYSQFTYQFTESGLHTVQLVARNYGCSDTITKTDYIKVLPPFPHIASVRNTCDGNRDLVTFIDASRETTSWRWDFGDGATTSYSAAQSTVTHTYPRTDAYKVILTATNGSCSVKDSLPLYVLLKQHPLLTAGTTAICNDQPMPYRLSNLENTSYTGVWVSYFFEKIEYGDGSSFAGYNPTFNSFVHPLPFDGTLQYFNKSQDKLRIIITESYFECKDTSNYIPLTFKGTEATFNVLTDDVCFKSPIVFADASVASVGYPIQSWKWDFGDGVIQTYTVGGTVSHIYANPGLYEVRLTVTDGSGCSATSSSQYVQVRGPKAAFYIPSTNVQLNTTLTFINNSNTFNSNNTTWNWDFGNGATSTAYSPSYTYTVPGNYVVRLIAINTVTGCRDTATQAITVKDFSTGFNTTVSFIGNYGQCPPVIARFFNTSTNYTKLVWDFGDGAILEDRPAPSHIYNVPGDYTVVLKVYGHNGLTGTFQAIIHVSQPLATIAASALEGCIGQQVVLHAPVHTNAVSYLWDFGNGYIVNAADSFATHSFQHPGNFTASLIVQDANGCRSSVAMPRLIKIHPDPVVNILPANPIACKDVPVVLQASGGVSYLWSPATGLNDNTSASPLALPATTTNYLVKVTDGNGCTGNSQVTVTVPQRFAMQAPAEVNLCKGNTAQLNVSGAQNYKWINTTTALSNITIPNPVASPLTTTLYTVVGYDQYNCYSDTAGITVNVRSSPMVNAGPDLQVLFGSENTLHVSASPDVVRWNWSPPDFLSCTSCPAPVTKPFAPIDYIITVYSAYNCKATDTLSIKAACSGNGIYIPNAFSPNHDGKNDLFTIGGYGVSLIRSFRIYDRWGGIVFEKKNFVPGDAGSSWDGRLKGVEAATGTYVYFVEMECGAGEKFERKGTVTLVR